MQKNPKYNFTDTLFCINQNGKIEPFTLTKIERKINDFIYFSERYPQGINENIISDSILGCLSILENESAKAQIAAIRNANITALQANVEMWYNVLFGIVNSAELLPKPPFYKAESEIDLYYANKSVNAKKEVLSDIALTSKTVYLLLAGLGFSEIMRANNETVEDIRKVGYANNGSSYARCFIPYFVYFVVYGSDYLNLTIQDLKEVWESEKDNKFWFDNFVNHNVEMLDLDDAYHQLLDNNLNLATH